VTGLAILAVASAAFVGTHFLMSHPLRAAIVKMLGERGFLIAYSIISIATLWWMVHAYGPASARAPESQWNAGEAGWIAATILMWLGSVLFVGSLRRNPAFPTGGAPLTHIGKPRGVFAITRHPMLWGFILWALVHTIVNPTPASLIVSAAIAILAIGGGAGQDAKKSNLLGSIWREWQRRTSFVPFGRGFAFPGTFALIGGTLLWLVASWAHGALGYRPAGAWAFFA